jgi:hypothetical protein
MRGPNRARHSTLPGASGKVGELIQRSTMVMELSSSSVFQIDALLNSAITSCDLECGWEIFLEVFDTFYSEQIRFEVDGVAEPVLGKEELRCRAYDLLVPLHVIVEVSGISVSIAYRRVPSDSTQKTRTSWTITFTSGTGTNCTVSWICERHWYNSRVIFERWYDKQMEGELLGLIRDKMLLSA